MATNHISTDLPTRIQTLLEERQSHEEAIARIDGMLHGVKSALGANAGATKRGPGRPAGRTATVEAAPLGRPAGKRRRRRSRGKYETTGDDSVLNFIRDHRNPTTRDVKAHWTSEGRRGTADNVLSKLYREKKIKRLPLPGERGSRYAVA